LREVIDQSVLVSHKNPQVAFTAADAAVARQLEHLESLDDPSDGRPIFVPDANALVRSPELDEWVFAGVPRFSVLLTPTLLSELDELKMTYRVENVRATAEAVINRVKEFGRRGDLHEGVTLRRERSTIRMVGAEADFARTLPWLDPNVRDDRLIAETIEAIRRHPRSPVTLVTADINLQSKARLAGIPFLEPPETQRMTRPSPDKPGKRRTEKERSLKLVRGGFHVALGAAPARALNERPEPCEIELSRLDPERVPGRPTHDPARPSTERNRETYVSSDRCAVGGARSPHRPALARAGPEGGRSPMISGRRHRRSPAQAALTRRARRRGVRDHRRGQGG